VDKKVAERPSIPISAQIVIETARDPERDRAASVKRLADHSLEGIKLTDATRGRI